MNKGLSTPVAIVIFGALLSLGVFFGLRYTNDSQQEVLPAKEGTAPQPTKQVSIEAQTTIDNDPILGDRQSAQMAIVEFSDFECSYCARFREETFDQIKETYIDSGHAILVYRDLPLPFHDPAATREANAAECVQEQAGDQAFWTYHDLIFENTPGNGQGLSEDELVSLASGLNINTSELRTCIENNQFVDEIKQDVNAADEAGITGTPGFVIGTLDEQGNVTGEIVKGARPFTHFDDIIEKYY